VGRDVTARKAAEERISQLATRDALTGLPNRVWFRQLLSVELKAARRYGRQMAVLFIDLDRFKLINEQAGRAAGDQLLRQLGRLLQSRVRETDLLARLDGDEFALMLLACPPVMAEKIAGVLRDSIAHFDFVWAGARYQVDASVAVVHVQTGWVTLDDCLAAADDACQQARQGGGGNIVVYGQSQR